MSILKLAQNLLKEILMPRFYFTLASKGAHITDDVGKEFDTLNDAYEHAPKLIHKILFHVGYDDAEAWKASILNDQHAAQIIVPFSVSMPSGLNAKKPDKLAVGALAKFPLQADMATSQLIPKRWHGIHVNRS